MYKKITQILFNNVESSTAIILIIVTILSIWSASKKDEIQNSRDATFEKALALNINLLSYVTDRIETNYFASNYFECSACTRSNSCKLDCSQLKLLAWYNEIEKREDNKSKDYKYITDHIDAVQKDAALYHDSRTNGTQHFKFLDPIIYVLSIIAILINLISINKNKN